MKFITFICVCAVLVLSCDQMNKESSTDKDTSPIIVKNGSFAYVQLNVKPVTLKEIFADITITNKSDNTFLFYKALLPFDGEAKTNMFSIFDNKSLDEINFIERKVGQYLKLAPDDEDGVIIPKLSTDNFIKFLPKQTMNFTLNLSKFYDFSKVAKGTSLSLTYSIYLPAVSLDYQQIFEKDTIDNKFKPVYYYIALPKKQSIDSMRVQFLIH